MFTYDFTIWAALVVMMIFAAMLILVIFTALTSKPDATGLNINACLIAIKVINHANQFPALKQDVQRETDLSKIIDRLSELIILAGNKRAEFSQAQTRKDKRRHEKEIRQLTKEVVDLSEKILNTVPV